MSSLPIGLFDSGFGGLTVLRALMKELPYEQFLYLADSQRVPYGALPPAKILQYSLECARFLVQKQIKLLVVACNTASAYAIQALQMAFDIPVIGVIEATIEKACLSQKDRFALLATEATIQSKIYDKKFMALFPKAKLTSLACPSFVSLIEKGLLHHPFTELVVKNHLQKLRLKEIDALLLGCTHYSFLKPLIQKQLSSSVALIDSAICCSEIVKKAVVEYDLFTPQKEPTCPRFYVSGSPDPFQKLGQQLLNRKIEKVEQVLLTSLKD